MPSVCALTVEQAGHVDWHEQPEIHPYCRDISRQSDKYTDSHDSFPNTYRVDFREMILTPYSHLVVGLVELILFDDPSYVLQLCHLF